MPSNNNYVCFDCRTALRRSKTLEAEPLCPSCHEPSVDIGYKLPVPPRDDLRAWDELRETVRQRSMRAFEEARQQSVRAIHRLEAEIERLEANPDNPGRALTVQQLKTRLDNLRRQS